MNNKLILQEELKRIKTISLYDTKKTLTENVSGGIAGFLGDIALSLIKKGSQIADDVSNNILEIAGKRYQIKEVTSSLRDANGNVIINKKLYNEAGTNEITSVTIGGKSVSASDIIKLSKNDLTNLSSTFTDNIVNIAVRESANNPTIKTQLETVAETAVREALPGGGADDAIEVARRAVTNQGKSTDEAINLAMKPLRDSGNFSDQELELIKTFYFRKKANLVKIGTKTITKLTKVLNYLNLKSLISNLNRGIKMIIGRSLEEFTEAYVQKMRGWADQLAAAEGNEVAEAKIYKLMQKDLEIFVDERTFLDEFAKSFPQAQKRAIEEIDNITRQTLTELGWSDKEITTFISKYKSDNILEMLDKYKKELLNPGGDLAADLKLLWDNFKEIINYPKNPSWLYKKFYGDAGGPWIVDIINFPIRAIRGIWKKGKTRFLYTVTTGTTKFPGELLRLMTRYGSGATNIGYGILVTYLELIGFKIFIAPIANFIGYSILNLVDLLLGSLPADFAKKWGLDVDLGENVSPIDFIVNEYTKWFNDTEWPIDPEILIPFDYNSAVIEAGFKLKDSLVKLANATPEDVTTKQNETENKLKAEKQKALDLALKGTNKIISSKSFEKRYTQIHDTPLYRLKYRYWDSSKEQVKERNNLTDDEYDRIRKSLGSLLCPGLGLDATFKTVPNPTELNKNFCVGAWTKDEKNYYKIKNKGYRFMFVENGEEKPIKELLSKDLADLSNKTEITNENYMKNLIKKIILEEEEEKTLKMKDWNEIFTFQKVDDKESGKFSEVKIKMDSVMDRMPHWRKKYKKQCEDMDNCDDDGEDDSFVRAVLDTHPEVVRVLFTKGMAHLTSSDDQEDLNESLHGLLAFLRESKNVEVEVWSVYRHPSSPDKIWSLVKGDYKPKELSSMDKKMQQSPGNSVEKKKDSLSELKKKESEAIRLLSTDEKKGLMELPIKVRNRVKEMIKKGWTTEKPSDSLMSYYKEDEVDSVFEDPIKVYKLRPNQTFFNFIKSQKSDDEIKRGFCRSIYYVEKEFDLPKEVSSKIDDILNKCENKLEGKYGQNYL